MDRIDPSISPNTDTFEPDAGAEAAPSPTPSSQPEQPASHNSVDPYSVSCQPGHPEAESSQQPWSGPSVPASELSQGRMPQVPAALARGSHGPEVVKLQQALLDAGYSVGPCGADGVFGPATEQAVLAFQHDHDGLKKTGVADAQTWGELRKSKKSSKKEGAKRHESGPRRTADGMPLLNQGDERWAKADLGHPRMVKETMQQAHIGDNGCLVTSLTMILSQRLGRDVGPDEVARAMLAHNAFDGANLYSWSSTNEALAKEFGTDLAFDHASTMSLKGAAAAARVDAELAAGRPTVLSIDYKGDAKADHYVVAQRKEKGADGQDVYVILDPADGQEHRYLLDAQGNFTDRETSASGRRRVVVGLTTVTR